MENPFESILNQLERIEALVTQITEVENSDTQASPDEFLGVKAAADFLGLAVPTLYSRVSKRSIPSIKRGGRLYFLKSDLVEWLKSGRRKTATELMQ